MIEILKFIIIFVIIEIINYFLTWLLIIQNPGLFYDIILTEKQRNYLRKKSEGK